MIGLIDFIFESQPIGELLTFDEFADFFNSDDTEMSKEKFDKQFADKSALQRKVLRKYIDRWAVEISKMNLEIDDNLLKYLYSQLCDNPVSKLDKVWGSGEEACIFNLKDKIVKCFYSGRIPSDRTKFFEICKENKYDVFPKVYRIGKGYVIMEKLEIETSKCKKYFDIINSSNHGDSIYHLVQDKKYDLSEMNDDEKEVINWLENVRKACAEAFGNDPKTNEDFGDLQLANVGERKDGTIVYFDI